MKRQDRPDPPTGILLIDDHADDRAQVIVSLGERLRLGRVLEVTSEEAFERALDAGGFHLVIADTELSWGPGLAVLRACKERHPQVPVILFTTAAGLEAAVEAMKAGAQEYLLKSPANLPRLATAVEEALQRAAARRSLEQPYRELFERLPVGLYRTAPDGRILEANPALAELLGFPDVPSLLSADATTQYVDPKQRTQWRLLAEQQEVVHDFDMQLRRPDGQVIWTRDTGRVVRDASGRVLYYEGALVDITERRRAETALEQSETMYRQLFETMLNGMATFEILLDCEGRPVDYRFLQVNPAFEALTGLTAEQVSGKTVRELFPGTESAWIERYGRVALTGEPIRFSDYSQDLGKHLEVVAFSPRRGQFATIFSDVTGQVQAHERLARERDFLRRIMETSPAGILILDRQGEITFANQRAEAVLGLQASQTQGRRYNSPEWQIADFDGHPFPHERLPFRQVLRTRQTVFGVQHAIAWPDGHRVLLSVNAAPLFDDAGEVDGMVATVEDITKRVRTEEAIRRAIAVLEAVRLAAHEFLRADSWKDVIEPVLARLGAAVAASRVHVFENHLDEGGRPVTSQRFEWVAEGITPQIDNPALQGFPWEESGFGRWQTVLGQGQTIVGLVRDMPRPEREVLEAQDIRSIAVVPVLAEGTWWGFIGFDECSRERKWSPAEIDALMAAGDTLGAAIQRHRTKQALERRLAELGELYQTSLEINAQRDVPELLKAIVERAARLCGTTMGGLYLVQADGQLLKLVVSHRLPGALVGTVLAPGEGLSGRVFQSGEVIAIEDYRSWDGQAPRYRGFHFGRILGVPLKLGARVIGVISVTDEKPGHFSPEEIRLVSLFADQAAIALENAHLFRETQRRAAYLEAITGVASALRAAPTRAEMLPIIRDEVLRLTQAEASAIVFHDEADQQDRVESASGAWAPHSGSALDGSLLMDILRAGQPYVTHEATRDSRLTGHVLAGAVQALAIVPLIAQDKPIGYLALGRAAPFSDEEVRLLAAVAGMASNALHRAGVMETLELRVAERTRALAEANERLQELDRLKSDFVSNVSHELRAPIANILLYLDLIAAPASESRHPFYMGILKNEAERLSRLIGDLLTLSRIERGALPLDAEPHPLDPLVVEVLAALLPRAANKAINLAYEPNPARPVAMVNRTQVVQVLTNLIHNAVTYTPQGGHISVACRQEQVSGREYVSVRVHNDGPSIAPEDLPHLFERFYRGKNARLAGEPGTGLGLAISKEIVERHQGWIDVESAEATGTSFTVWLPAATAPEIG
ncbi:MAG: GAF domain-containing protein [Chloroflexota bacterium]